MGMSVRDLDSDGFLVFFFFTKILAHLLKCSSSVTYTLDRFSNGITVLACHNHSNFSLPSKTFDAHMYDTSSNLAFLHNCIINVMKGSNDQNSVF